MEVGERGGRVRTVGGSRAGKMRITRFLRNPKSLPPARSGVSVEEIVSEARQKTLGTASGRHIVAIQDTTTPNKQCAMTAVGVASSPIP